MTPSTFSDTSIAVRQGHRARIAALTPSERLARALALSVLVRRIAWAGAERVAGAEGHAAIRRRFLVQAYGTATADWVARRMAAEPEP